MVLLKLSNSFFVPQASIAFIQSDDSYTKVNMLKGDKIKLEIIPRTLKTFENVKGFLRISRTCIINMDYIESIQGEEVTLRTGHKFYIGTTYKSKIYTTLSQCE